MLKKQEMDNISLVTSQCLIMTNISWPFHKEVITLPDDIFINETEKKINEFFLSHRS